MKIPLINWRVARMKRFVAQASGCFLQSAGYSTPLFFYAAYARAQGYSNKTATNFITVSNASNLFRVSSSDMALITTDGSMPWLLQRWSAPLLYLPFGYCLCLKSRLSRDLCGRIVHYVHVLYGAFANAYISLFPVSLIELFGAQDYTSVNGSLYLIRGMGALIGTPLTGLLIPEPKALVSSIIYERAGITVGCYCSQLRRLVLSHELKQ